MRLQTSGMTNLYGSSVAELGMEISDDIYWTYCLSHTPLMCIFNVIYLYGYVTYQLLCVKLPSSYFSSCCPH